MRLLDRTLFFVLGAAVSKCETPTQPTLVLDDLSTLCTTRQETVQQCISLPPDSTSNIVDVFFLLDDTTSFLDEIHQLEAIMDDVISGLRAEMPEVDLGVGVGRFEDYGGPGRFFSKGENIRGRPFILNQPIITTAEVGSEDALKDRIVQALPQFSGFGFGGDGPESANFALFQVATGVGFDADDSGSSLGLDGSQIAGASTTQLRPDESGDVPPFSSLDSSVDSAGTIGGVGWRENSLRIIMLATDICAVAAFNGPTISEFVETQYSRELSMDFRCSDRFRRRVGFVSDSIANSTNTVANAVAPRGAPTVEETVQALVDEGIRVIGMAPHGQPRDSGSGPSIAASVYLSAMGRITGTLNTTGSPMVVNLLPTDNFGVTNSIIDAIVAAANIPANIALRNTCTAPDLSITVSSDLMVATADENACFDVTFEKSHFSVVDTCSITFQDTLLGITYATVPLEVSCLNERPIARCRDVFIINSGTCPLTLDPRILDDSSEDPDGDPLTFAAFPPGPYDDGMTNVVLTVSDGELSATCGAEITVQCNRPTTFAPTSAPSNNPTDSPSSNPSALPTTRPTDQPCLCPEEDLEFVWNDAIATWEDHKETAMAFGCVLASVTSIEEQNSLNAVISPPTSIDSFVYIGGKRNEAILPPATPQGRTAETGGWFWDDGSVFSDLDPQNSSWSGNQPDDQGDDEDRIAVNQRAGDLGRWYDKASPREKFTAVYKCCFADNQLLSQVDYSNCAVA